MVGRLIEDEQVAGFKQQFNHRQTASFSSGEHFDFFVRGFSAEHECSQYVAYFRANISYCHVVDGLEDCEVLIQQSCLILSKIAYFDIVSYFERAEVVQLIHNTADECRFSFAVFADKSYFLSSSDGKSNIVENVMFAEIFTQVLYDYRKISAPRRRWEAQVESRSVLQIHFESLEFLELLDSALYLYGFCCFITEALYELFCVLNHLLLVEVRPYLLFMPLFAQFDEPAVVDVVVVNTAECYLNGSAAYIIDECAVVADHEYGRRTCFEKILQPLDRLDVQVVSRLVQQQQVRMAQQDFRQFNTHSPPARKLCTRSVKVLSLKAETDDGSVHLCDKPCFVCMLFLGLIHSHDFFAKGSIILE